MYTDFLNKTNQAKVEVAQQHNNMRLIHLRGLRADRLVREDSEPSSSVSS